MHIKMIFSLNNVKTLINNFMNNTLQSTQKKKEVNSNNNKMYSRILKHSFK